MIILLYVAWCADVPVSCVLDPDACWNETCKTLETDQKSGHAVAKSG